MKLALKIWRQNNASSKGKMVDYTVDNIEPDMSFLEMLDILNDEFSLRGKIPLLLTTIVVKEFVECVHFSLTERPMARIDWLLHVNYTCGNSRTETRFT